MRRLTRHSAIDRRHNKLASCRVCHAIRDAIRAQSSQAPSSGLPARLVCPARHGEVGA